MPEAGQGARCAILGEERREAAGAEPSQTLFRAYVAYPDRELSPNESITLPAGRLPRPEGPRPARGGFGGVTSTR